MRLRARCGLAAAAVVALACGGGSDPGPRGIHATWTFAAPATSCASIAGAVTVGVVATAASTGDLFVMVTSCDAGETMLELPADGDYTVVISLANAQGQAIDASLPQTVYVAGTVHVAATFDGVM